MYGHYERVSRQELYDLIWSVPATTLCKRFQLSGRGLGKLCERHEIPVPERGWWAKHAAGQPVERAPLPKASSAYLERIEVWVRQDWREYLAEDELTWFEHCLAREATLNQVTLAEADDSRHPLIVRVRRERKETEPARLHFQLNVGKDQRPRALRLAAAIVKGCEERGYTFAQRPNDTSGAAGVVILGQNIGITIEEPYSKVPHVLTKAEAREKAVGRGWSIPEFDSVRSGSLVISLIHSADGERRTFTEKSEYPLESNFPELFKALPQIALRMRANDNWRAAQERERREEAARRAEAERLRREEEARIAADRRRRSDVIRAGARLRQANDILALVALVEETAAERSLNSQALTEWTVYARGVANGVNPLERILAQVTSVEGGSEPPCRS